MLSLISCKGGVFTSIKIIDIQNGPIIIKKNKGKLYDFGLKIEQIYGEKNYQTNSRKSWVTPYQWRLGLTSIYQAQDCAKNISDYYIWNMLRQHLKNIIFNSRHGNYMMYFVHPMTLKWGAFVARRWQKPWYTNEVVKSSNLIYGAVSTTKAMHSLVMHQG